MIRKIVLSTDPVIRQKAKTVKKFDKKLKSLAKDLIDTLKSQKDPEGVGLAACQIGKPLAIFAFVDKDEKIRIIVNPKILAIKEGKTKKKRPPLEGCLSIPDYYGYVKRVNEVTLEYQDLEGNKKTETFKGFQAQIIQHEVDHLNGIVFVDHLLKQKQPLYELTEEGWEKVEI